jgi:4'-phosphopantetheinyl transferase
MVPLRRLPSPVPRETLDGAAGIVDLWCFFYESAQDPALLSAYVDLMTAEERARHDRYVFERDRLQFLATRAVVRTVLSSYADVRAEDWRFGEGSHGRPHIHAPATIPILHFNLSNTPGLVVCAVSTAHAEVGVDAESLERPGATVSIADDYFSPAEVRALRAVPAARQRQRFFAYWTLKESYIKAKGLGLAIPLDQFSFAIAESDHIHVTFDQRLRDDASLWRFALFDAPPRHVVAVGVKTGGGPLSVRATSFVPLRGTVPFAPGPS